MVSSPYLKSAGFDFVPIECFFGLILTGEFFYIIKSIKIEIRPKFKKVL